jgi:hypothetical protein
MAGVTGGPNNLESMALIGPACCASMSALSDKFTSFMGLHHEQEGLEEEAEKAWLGESWKAAAKADKRPVTNGSAKPETLSPLAATAKAEQVERQSLKQVHAVFKKWLGDDYDIGALNAVLAVAASEKLCGDPAWLLIISGPGNAKTETCQSLSRLSAHIISTISSEGALLSGTSDKSRSKAATGGLLRKIGDRGLLVVKDFTSILSANRDTRASVLAALREIHDGNWVRSVGTDGGKTLTWSGRESLSGPAQPHGIRHMP